MEHSEFRKEITPEGNFDHLETIQTKSGRLVMASDAFGRLENEDRVFFDPDSTTFVVADGMGGYNHGEVAAESVVKAVQEGIENNLSPQQMQFKAFEIMKQLKIAEGGAAYLAGRIEKKKLNLWYAGDVSGIIFNQKGEIKYRTKDGGLRDVPTGQKPGQVTTESVELMNYDRILIASDGLWDNIVFPCVADIVKNKPIDQVLKELAAVVKEGMTGLLTDGSPGNADNLTILLYEILPADLRR